VGISALFGNPCSNIIFGCVFTPISTINNVSGCVVLGSLVCSAHNTRVILLYKPKLFAQSFGYIFFSLVYTQVHIDAAGLLIAHNGMMGLLLLLLVLPIIYTLSNATVSVHVVKSPNMRNPESCDNTCMNSHLLRPL
jgi:hypothetical protein